MVNSKKCCQSTNVETEHCTYCSSLYRVFDTFNGTGQTLKCFTILLMVNICI